MQREKENSKSINIEELERKILEAEDIDIPLDKAMEIVTRNKQNEEHKTIYYYG